MGDLLTNFWGKGVMLPYWFTYWVVLILLLLHFGINKVLIEWATIPFHKKVLFLFGAKYMGFLGELHVSARGLSSSREIRVFKKWIWECHPPGRCTTVCSVGSSLLTPQRHAPQPQPNPTSSFFPSKKLLNNEVLKDSCCFRYCFCRPVR